MDLHVTIADEVGQSYGEIYSFPADSKISLVEFIEGSIATYLENAHVGHQLRAQEQAIKQPFQEAQAARAEAAKPEVAEIPSADATEEVR